MWQERQAQLLKDEIEAVLMSLAEVADLRNLAKEPLGKCGRGLALETAHDGLWPLLPLMVCEAISGYHERAIPLAASLQLLMAAGDLFDDIEDADSPDLIFTRYGSGVATNVATTLLILAEKEIARLKNRSVEDSTIVRVMESVNSFYTIACAGQHLDLSMNLNPIISEDDYLNIIGMKSASQVQCACHAGALLATTNQELIDLFATFGHNLGMAAQITNDIQGITCGSDILNRKISLPVIYTLTQTDGETRKQLELTFSESISPTDPTQIRDLLFSSGAIHYAMVKIESYKQFALDNLFEAERAGARIGRLKLFLD